MTMFQCIALGYLRRLNIASSGSDKLRKKGCQKGKGVWFWFVSLIFVTDFLLLIFLFLRTFDGLTTVWSKIFTDVNLLNSQEHFYQAYGRFVTNRQTPVLNILAASKICAKFVNNLV